MSLPPGDPSAAVEKAVGELRVLAHGDGVHTAALALDPLQWQLLRFMVWEDSSAAQALLPEAPEQHPAEHYEVLHVSSPDLSDIALGRHW